MLSFSATTISLCFASSFPCLLLSHLPSADNFSLYFRENRNHLSVGSLIPHDQIHKHTCFHYFFLFLGVSFFTGSRFIVFFVCLFTFTVISMKYPLSLPSSVAPFSKISLISIYLHIAMKEGPCLIHRQVCISKLGLLKVLSRAHQHNYITCSECRMLVPTQT